MSVPKRPRPYDRTTHDGRTVDWLTKAAIMRAERRLGYPLSITQGSYNAGAVSASAGTHDAGGVVDLRAWDGLNKVRALRAEGFVAWFRSASEGPWPDHVHAVQAGNRRLAPSALRQVTAFRQGRNGLANRAPDPHAGIPVGPTRWPYGGPIGMVRWHLDNRTGADRRKFRRRMVRRLRLRRTTK